MTNDVDVDVDRTNGILVEEERTPSNECENDDSTPTAKHCRRVSWSIIEAVDIDAPDRDTATSCLSSDPTEAGCQRISEIAEITTTLIEKLSSVSKPTAPHCSLVTERKTKLLEMNIDEDRQGHSTASISTQNEPNKSENFARRDDCTTSMNPSQDSRLVKAGRTSIDAVPLPEIAIPNSDNEEDPEAVREGLRNRVSRLQEIILSMRKIDTIQNGRNLVKEYECQSQLEGLYEDVFFLKAKKDRLGANLLDLHVKKVDLLRSAESSSRSSSSAKTSREAGRRLVRRHKNDRVPNVTKHARKKSDVSDASVQTDDWLIADSGVRSISPLEPTRTISQRSIE